MAIYSWVPIAILDFYRDGLISPLTPILSLLTIPVVSLILYPSTLFFVFLLGGVPHWLVMLWGFFFSALITLIDQVPYLFTVQKGIGLMIGVVLILGRMMLRFRGGRVVLILGLMLLRFGVPPPLPNQVVQLDVGQGDSTLIQASGKNELVDVGSARALSPEMWIRKLSRFGVSRFDGLLLTHLDEDHEGGLQALLSVVSVSCVEISHQHQKELRGQRLISWLKDRIPNTSVQSGNCIHLSKVSWFKSHRAGAKGNDWMAGVVHELSPNEVYFGLGDGDFEQERQFGIRYHREIQSHRIRIWKVGHHGSRFSSDTAFLQMLDPDQVWISVGKKNRYHHPSREALARLSRLQAALHRTDQEGDLVYHSVE